MPDRLRKALPDIDEPQTLYKNFVEIKLICIFALK